METGRELSEAMDETIRTTLADINSRVEPDARIPTEEPPSPAAAEPTEPPAEPTEPPARDTKTGQFRKGEQQRHKPAQTAKSSVAQAEPTKTQPAAVPEPAAAEPAEPALKFGAVEIDLKRPPASWKPAAKAQWNALPEDIRKEIYRRESDFHTTVLTGPMKQNADFGNAVRSVIEPYRPMIEAEGGTPEKAIGELLKTAALFRGSNQQAKLNAIFGIDQQFNTGLRQHFQNAVQSEVARLTGGAAPQGQPQPQQQFSDPRYDALAGQFQQITQALQQQEAARTAEADRIANSATDQFLLSKNEKGEPKFPFVDNVIDDLVSRVAALRQMNPAKAHNEILQEAYDGAVWANPETRAVLIAQTNATQQAAAQTAQKVAQAKRTQVGAMPKRGAIPATEPAKSLDDTIRDTGRELGMF